ncbi:hypothetical protein pb186bvf_003199 [Paramecium bursaria]
MKSKKPLVPRLQISKLQSQQKGRSILKLPQISIGTTLTSIQSIDTQRSKQSSIRTPRATFQSPTLFEKGRPYMKSRLLTERSHKTSDSVDLTFKSLVSTPRPQFSKQCSIDIDDLNKNKLFSKKVSQTPTTEMDVVVEEIRPKQDSIRCKQESVSSIRNKQESVSSQFTQLSEEYYSVWDNVDLYMRGVVFDEIEQQQQIQQFLILLKMRSGGFPGQRENLANEEVIQMAVQYARQNKALFRKYFPTNQVVFEDNEDYSKSYNVAEDPNFLKFKTYVNELQGQPEEKVEKVDKVMTQSQKIAP